MRDIALTIFVFSMIPVILRHAWVGILMWTWIGIMNPHKLTFGFAFNFPFGMVVGVATIIAIVISRQPKRIPWTAPVILVAVFTAWMSITTLFAINPSMAWPFWEKVMTIQFMIFMTLLVIKSKRQIQWLTWVMAGSLAFYGIKGGLFTLQGGSGMVLGPPGGFIEGNTGIALAITMAIPLLVYAWMQATRKWLKWAIVLSIALSAVAVLGSYSRGGLLAILAMGVFLWGKSRHKFVLSIIAVVLLPIVFAVMPARWFDRMNTIQTYEEDSSAMGRINAWHFAINATKDRPITGLGFQGFTEEAFYRWAPNPTDFHDAHSIYFGVLGEHGYVGLLLFLLIWGAAWMTGRDVQRRCRDRPDLIWAKDLATMAQVSLIGFLVGGAFLKLCYWDFPYILLAILVLIQDLLVRETAAVQAAGRQTNQVGQVLQRKPPAVAGASSRSV